MTQGPKNWFHWKQHLSSEHIVFDILANCALFSCRRAYFSVHKFFVLNTCLPLVFEKPVLSHPSTNADLANGVDLFLENTFSLKLFPTLNLPFEPTDQIRRIICDIGQRFIGFVSEGLEDKWSILLSGKSIAFFQRSELVIFRKVDPDCSHGLHAGPTVDFQFGRLNCWAKDLDAHLSTTVQFMEETKIARRQDETAVFDPFEAASPIVDDLKLFHSEAGFQIMSWAISEPPDLMSDVSGSHCKIESLTLAIDDQ